MSRVLASQTTRKRIEDMVNGLSCEFDKSELIREAARLIVEEVTDSRIG